MAIYETPGFPVSKPGVSQSQGYIWQRSGVVVFTDHCPALQQQLQKTLTPTLALCLASA